MISPTGNYVPVYQSSLFLPMKRLKVEFGPGNISLKIYLT